MGTVEGKTVCVTGASGHIASWLTKLLLHRGYTVRATVRNLDDKTKTEHLWELDGAKERLKLFEAKLLIQGSFDSAIQGCDGVFHTASPCFSDCQDPQTELIDPAVEGTMNVLRSCSKASTVKRVVLTASVDSMVYKHQTLPPVLVDESWFSDLQFCKQQKHWYALGKTLAEEAAWKYVKEKGIDMVTTHPALVVGSLLQPTLNDTSAIIASLVNPESGNYDDSRMIWIHVKDVADAHILLFENPLASGRYPLVESAAYLSEIITIIHELYPTIKIPNKSGKATFPDYPPFFIDRMKELGMDSYIPLKVAIKETIQSLREKKFITI